VMSARRHHPVRAAFATTAVDEGGIPLFAATMLEPGELILGTWRPSPTWIGLRSARTLAFAASIGALAASASAVAGLGLEVAITQVAVAAVLVRVTIAVAEWASRVYVLTDRRVLRRRGVLAPSVYSATLNSLRRVELLRSRTDRLFRTGTITFSARGTGGHDAAWVMVQSPDRVLALVESARRRYGR
jgi:hypothetical protein